MEYKVTSDKKVCGQRKGGILTDADIITAGGNIKKLLACNCIEEVGKTPQAKQEVAKEPEVLELQDEQVPQEEPQAPQAFVYKSQEQGDK